MCRHEIWVLTLAEEQAECSRYSDLAMGWGIQVLNPGKSRVFFSFCKISRPAVGPTQAAIEGAA